MSSDSDRQILKGVSRSFYLSLRLLPAPMREPVSLAYLLARTSDTIADTSGVSVVSRLDLLTAYEAAVLSATKSPAWPMEMMENATDSETRLLEKSEDLLQWLRRTDAASAVLIREVVKTIISGQKADLMRFGEEKGSAPVALANAEELDDYAWRVAGCVGEFWTRIGFLKLGKEFSTASEEELVNWGVDYGKGLQLVNILRDLPRDLKEGRCYLPVDDPRGHDALLGEFRRWHSCAKARIDSGLRYAETIKSRRLRMATVLPVLIAVETLDLLDDIDWFRLDAGVKVPRRDVYRLLAEAAFF